MAVSSLSALTISNTEKGSSFHGKLAGRFPVDFEYLVIAGGGGTPATGSGGGAGGYRNSYASETSGGGSPTETPKRYKFPSSFVVTVGAGGAGLANGSDSVFDTITSIGGGRGVYTGQNGVTGGSAGGGGRDYTSSASGTTGQGYAGGRGDSNKGWGGGGGGGGAGSAGTNGTNVSNGAQGGERAGNGGNGLSSSITGTAVTRGGGGGCFNQATGGHGSGGTGGGARAGWGAANTGGGAGGGGTGNKNGGSGIVILRYPTSLVLTIGAGLTYTTTIGNDYTVTQFTAGTGTVSVDRRLF